MCCTLHACFVPKCETLVMHRLLEERLKAMLTSLPLVSDLHHPAMRERHWSQLMKVGINCAAAFA